MNNDELKEQKTEDIFNPDRSVKIVEAKFTLTDDEPFGQLPKGNLNDKKIDDGAA